MHPMRANKVSVAGIDRYLDGLRREMRRSARNLLLVRMLCLFGVVGLFFLLVGPLGFGALMLMLLTGVFAWAFQGSRAARHALVVSRVGFLDQLLQRLRDELAPAEKLRVRYHLQPVDSATNKVKSAKSSAGNTKTYYRSVWLRVRGALADGTRFRIRLRRSAKCKKGQTLREHDALVLEVTPPAGRFPDGLHDTGESLPWGLGAVTMRRTQGKVVFRFLAREDEMLEQLYRALRYTVALYPAASISGPAPGAGTPA